MSAPKNWQDMTHAELDAAVQSGPGPGASMAAEAQWRELARVITEAEARMHAAVGRSAGGWEGSGGDAARSGLHSLNSWVLGAATDAQTTLSTMIDQGVASGRLRSSLPAPNTEQLTAARDSADVNLFDEGVQRGALAAEEDARALAESARRAMETYHHLSVENRRTIDFWTAPPTVVVAAVTWSGSGSGGLGPPGGGSSDLGASGVGLPGSSLPGPAEQALSGGSPQGADGPLPAGPVAGVPLGGGGGGMGGAGFDGGPSPSGAAPSGAVVGGGPATPGAIGPVGGSAPAGSTGVPGAVPVTGPAGRGAPVALGRDALPPGAGGRGQRNPTGGGGTPGGGWGGTGPRAVLPGAPPVGSPAPTWRDVVSGLRGGGGPGVPADPRTGGGAGPRSDLRAVPASTPAADAGRGGTAGGLYPPMGGGTAGGQGEGRRRAPYLVDDSGAFDVDVPYTDPVIGAVDLTDHAADGRDRR